MPGKHPLASCSPPLLPLLFCTLVFSLSLCCTTVLTCINVKAAWFCYSNSLEEYCEGIRIIFVYLFKLSIDSLKKYDFIFLLLLFGHEEQVLLLL